MLDYFLTKCPMVLRNKGTSTYSHRFKPILQLVSFQRNWIKLVIAHSLNRVHLSYYVRVKNVRWTGWRLLLSYTLIITILPKVRINHVTVVSQSLFPCHVLTNF